MHVYTSSHDSPTHPTTILSFFFQYGGGPLYQACNLDLPETTRALLEHGASVVQEYNGVTPIELALNQKSSRCVKVSGEVIETKFIHEYVFQELFVLYLRSVSPLRNLPDLVVTIKMD